MVIYADVLAAINYFISLAMLHCVSRLSGVPLTRRGAVLGGLVGGIASLTVFLPWKGLWAGVALRCLSAAGMLWAAWPGRTRREYLQLGLLLLTVSFLFAGGVMAWCLIFPAGPVSFPGGMVYFRISPLTLLISVTASYLVLTAARRLFGKKSRRQLYFTVKLTRSGRTVTLSMLQDTGNSLTEPFSGLPVAVCPLEKVRPLLKEEELCWLEQGSPPEFLPQGFRLVRYCSVSGDGFLGAFRPDAFVMQGAGESWDCLGWVAVSPSPMAGCDGVLPAAMLELRI